MAHCWKNDGTKWNRLPITGGVITLPPSVPRDTFDPASPRDTRRSLIKQFNNADRTSHWVLLCGIDSRTRVNGKCLSGGLHILRDRDEIRADDGSPLYFSTEEVATIEPCPGQGHPVFCARCRQQIETGSPAVKCPSCGHWCEQSESKPCWTYGPTCPLCEQPTPFDTGLRWTPETL